MRRRETAFVHAQQPLAQSLVKACSRRLEHVEGQPTSTDKPEVLHQNENRREPRIEAFTMPQFC